MTEIQCDCRACRTWRKIKGTPGPGDDEVEELPDEADEEDDDE